MKHVSARLILLATGMALCSASAFAKKPITYTYTTITVPNSVGISVAGINASGTVVGNWYDNTYTEHGFIYQNGTLTTLDDPNAVNGSIISGINNKGEIVGTYSDANYVENGFTYVGGTFTTVDMPNTNGTDLSGVDSAGVVFGTASGTDNAQIIFSYKKNKFTTLPISGSPVISSVSDKGSLAGFYFTSPFTAMLYANGTAITLPLNAPNGASAFGVNSSNTVVGYTLDASNTEAGFIYANGTATSVSVPNAKSTVLTAINDAGVAVGYSTDSSYNETDFVYSNGAFTTLPAPAPGAIYPYAENINKMGQVIGTYYDASFNQDAYIATPSK
jgi:probable HAF family extracellular repeat protein